MYCRNLPLLVQEHYQRAPLLQVQERLQTFPEKVPVLRKQVPEWYQMLLLQIHPLREPLQNHPVRVRGNSQRDRRSMVQVHQTDCWQRVHQIRPGMALQIPSMAPELHRTLERVRHQSHPGPEPHQSHHHRRLPVPVQGLRTCLSLYRDVPKRKRKKWMRKVNRTLHVRKKNQ